MTLSWKKGRWATRVSRATVSDGLSFVHPWTQFTGESILYLCDLDRWLWLNEHNILSSWVEKKDVSICVYRIYPWCCASSVQSTVETVLCLWETSVCSNRSRYICSVSSESVNYCVLFFQYVCDSNAIFLFYRSLLFSSGYMKQEVNIFSASSILFYVSAVREYLFPFLSWFCLCFLCWQRGEGGERAILKHL